MDSPLFLDLLRALHLLGMAIGLGLAILADVWAARSFFRPVRSRDIQMLHILHVGVSCGLAMLWISGLGLLSLRTGLDLNAVTPKLLAKLTIIVMLTANALVITSYAMPLLHMTKGARFAQNNRTLRLELASVAGISMGCWVSAFALGVFSQMKPMEAGQLSYFIGLIFIVTTGAALAIGYFAPQLERLLLRKSDEPQARPALRAGPSGATMTLPHMPSLPQLRALLAGLRRK